MPEVASRHQLEAIIPVLETAFAEAGVGWEAIDAIAATYGPGLAGSLLVGLTAGKTLALARGLPFLGVNHLEAHIYANWLRTGEHEQADPEFPLLALVISGAHCELVYIADMAATSCWARRATTRRARRSTRWRVCWASAIPVARRSSRRCGGA